MSKSVSKVSHFCLKTKIKSKIAAKMTTSSLSFSYNPQSKTGLLYVSECIHSNSGILWGWRSTERDHRSQQLADLSVNLDERAAAKQEDFLSVVRMNGISEVILKFHTLLAACVTCK